MIRIFQGAGYGWRSFVSLIYTHLSLLNPNKAMSSLFSIISSSTSSPQSQLFRQNVHTPSNSIIRCCDDTARLNLKPHDNNVLAGFPQNNQVLSQAAYKKPPRSRRIILVRHDQSEGNVDETVYTRVDDPKVRLIKQGVAEAEECGRKMREMIEKDGAEDWKVYFYVSPYRRGLETLRNLAKHLNLQELLV